MKDEIIYQTRAYVIIAYAQSSHAKCDLEPQANGMVLVRNTSSCDDYRLFQIILKSNLEGQSYSRSRA